MLAASVNETPRPRPPAKIRRSSALLQAASPPPSYAAAFTLTPEGKPRVNTLLGSPMSATLQRVGWESGAADRRMSPSQEEDMEWMNERSREELSELLVKADDLIKERENELSMASAVCKSLYDNNVVLKSKHQQLLARLPSARTPSPSPEPLSRTSSRYSVSLSRPISEYDSSPVASTYKSHARKISVSTSEISHLADQNAELLQKLERMESESLSADQSGRRALKRLEKEILILREELEKTQAKSEELEQKAKAGWDSEKIVKEVLRKKEERDAKFRAMRNLGQGRPENEEEEDEQEIRDFAPEGSVFGGPSSAFSFFPSGDTPRRPTGTPMRRPAPALAPAPFTPHPESTLIAQLLEKIQELEETNSRIIDQQNETTNQLNAMQRETEHINKVYECFADANFIEEVGDDDATSDKGERSLRDETIRFRSFKRKLEGDFCPSPNANDMRKSLNISTASKTRKSVVGLFDGPQDDNRGASTPDQLKSYSLPVPFASPAPSEGHYTSLSVESTGLVSPALSSLSLSPSQINSQNSLNGPHLTLETELGNECTGSWGLNADNNHSRTNSLYDLTQTSAPASPSPSSVHASFNQSRNIGSPQDPRETLPTPVSMPMGKSSLQLSVEPPTPDKVAAAAKDREETPSKQSLRYHRMTETVRSRTNRWVDGRFKDTLTGGTKVDIPAYDHDDEQKASRPSTPLPLRLAGAFDAAVENFTSQPTRSSSQASGRNPENKTEKKPRGFGAVMLELWLWLQFAIIILVFLWAMAKRGPKSVLGEAGAGHRTTVSSASSR